MAIGMEYGERFRISDWGFEKAEGRGSEDRRQMTARRHGEGETRRRGEKTPEIGSQRSEDNSKGQNFRITNN